VVGDLETVKRIEEYQGQILIGACYRDLGIMQIHLRIPFLEPVF
jgi:hypothetical protein